VGGVDALEGANEARAELAEFASMMLGERVKESTAFSCDAEDDAAAVCRVFGPLEEAFGDGAVDEFDHSVVAKAKALGGVCDGGEGSIGNASNLE
jgi:hypothetical protein